MSTRPVLMSRLRAPLTPTQRDVHLDQQLHPGLTIYSIGCSVCVGPELDRALWEEAVRAVFASEPIMRTRLEESEVEVFQYVDDQASMHLGFDDGVAADADALHAWIDQRLRESRGPQALFQHWLVRTTDGNFYAALGAPHPLSDGHSYRLFFERVSRCYEALLEQRPLPELISPSFYDYVREAAPVTDDAEALALWQTRLAGVGPLHFRTRREVPGDYGTERVRLSTAETEAVATFCRKHSCGLATFFLALHATVLQRYREPTGDWAVHVIRGARPPRFRETMGCFFDVLPYRMPEERLRRPARLADLFGYLRDYRRDLGPRHEISMLRLQDCLPNSGCRAVYNFYDFDRVHVLGRARSLNVHFSHPPSEVHLVVGSVDGRVELRHFTHTSQLCDSTVLKRVRRLALQVIGGAQRIGDLDWLLDHERRPAPEPKSLAVEAQAQEEKPVHELFEEQAERQPDAVAVVAGERRYTYAELNSYANRLARLLVREGVGPEVLVALHLERSFEQVAAVLAVLKAGGAYVPIDPEYPEARVRFILDDSRVQVLIADGLVCNAPDGVVSRTLRLDEVGAQLEGEEASNLGSRAAPRDLAYVIYTSGSTGEPKGVMVTHHNVSRLFLTTRELFVFDASDAWPLLHSYAFDFSVWEMWGALAFGGRLVVVPSCVARSPEDLRELLAREDVTVLNQTPSAFYRFMEAERTRGDARLAALRLIVFGGEALDAARLRPWFDRYGNARPTLVNMYGITETTVHVTWRRVQRADCEPGRPSVIGRPLPDLRIYMTDEEGQLVPRGVAGELCVGGKGVARGYLHRDELTRARFAEDRFAPEADQRLYRSGDLARELEDGDLEYVGRMDRQVQIRGYRVELGEIESTLGSHSGVADAAVVADADSGGDLSLTAYVVPRTDGGVDEAELRELLHRRLPSYMGCARYCFLSDLPLTPHGKVDRTALPAPDSERPQLAVRYVPPRTQTEELLANLFSGVTGLEKVGIHDDFFALGGNSLSATMVLAGVREPLGLEVPLDAIFAAPTVARLAEVIENAHFADDADASPRVVRVESGEDPPLTFAQERAWLIQQLAPQSVAYQFEAALRFFGDLRVDVLERCLRTLVERHEVLRTSFPQVNGRPVQRVHPSGPVALETVTLEHLAVEKARRRVETWRRETAGQALRLDRLPLIRWTLFRLPEAEHVLIHREHHLLHDGWSFVVLLGELLRLYRTYLDNRPSQLPPLPVRLGDFAHAEREWVDGPAAAKQLAYWQRQLAGAPQSLELPADFARPGRPSYRGDAIRFVLPEDEVRRLRGLARENGVTLFAAMLGVFAVLLARWSGEPDLCIGSGVANRRRPELQGVVGMLLNNVVLRLNLRQGLPLATLLQDVQRVVLEALTNQDLPFDRVVRLVRSGANPAGAPPVCPVFFSSYEGPIPQVPIPGLTVDVEAGLPNGSAKFDLNVIVAVQPRDGFAPPASAVPSAERVTVIWEYSTDLFERATMEEMAQDYMRLLRSSVGDAERPWYELGRDVDLESEGARDDADPTPPPASSARYPRDASIVDLWHDQLRRAPDAMAVRDVHGTWTYREVDVFANRLAHLLRQRGVRREEVVGICLPRGRVAIASMLGVLKAGAAYFPLDPRQPERRIAWLADDADARFVLTYASSRPLLEACAEAQPLCLDELEDELARSRHTEPPRVASAEGLAYVMYTSGSTGPPKGVEILHRGVVRLLFGVDYVLLDRDIRILQLSPLSFDASTFEIWGALLHGGMVVVYPEEIPDVGSLGRAIAEEDINTMWLNASLFNAIVDEDAGVLAPVEQLLIGGESLSVEHVRRAYLDLPGTQIINGYGPTENTTFSCCFAIPRDLPASAASVPLGRPISHSSVYVLDERMRPVPRGAIGEVYLGGDGLARGYRSRPELTAERFLPDPFSSAPEARLYRSGDLGRVRADGTLEFRGRRDDQIKIRGFRIEPAEIEWALHRLPGVRRSAVVATGNGAPATRLVAYVVPEPGIGVDADGLRGQARLELPSHLVPQEIVIVDALPLSPHGKLDRAALPAPPSRPAPTRPMAPPRTASEERVASVMAEVLDLEEVGIDDQFFELGGHSLLGLELLGRLSRLFGVEIPVRALIEYPTVAGLAALIEQEDERRGAAAGNGRLHSRVNEAFGIEPNERSRLVEPTVAALPREVKRGDFSSVVPIRPGGEHPPFFLVAGGVGGEAELLVYARLVRYLDSRQPFYGLRARGVDDLVDPHDNVETMATEYIEEIRKAQPHGPYFIGGSCMGGMVAFETAVQLRDLGEKVALLVLVDSPFPSWLGFLRNRATNLWRNGVRPALARSSTPQATATVLREAARQRVAPSDEQRIGRRKTAIGNRYLRRMLRYRVRPYDGKLTLVACQERKVEDAARVWRDFAAGGLEIRYVPGNHFTHLREHAATTAACLDDCLRRAREEHDRAVP